MPPNSNRVRPAATVRRNWLELPSELTESILKRLSAFDVYENARKVCRTWRHICSQPSMWRVVNLMHPGDPYEINYDAENIYRKAVDMSSGELVEFRMNHFANDELLEYVADRSSRLRCLHLECCSQITNEGLSEMLRKLPLLEELHLYRIRISKQTIEVAGRCCLQLKTFKLNYKGHRKLHIGCDENAMAIAENMPGIRHLQLFGNRITKDGLLAILENCPHLESLDIRHCYKAANLGPDLERRLSQQMKYLKLPHDSTKDSEFKAEIYELDSSDEDDNSGQSDSDIDIYDYDYGYMLNLMPRIIM
ncbi:F-box protein SKIP19 [Heracleum sosnowskyi]|uniref:F-box protein SKIP19 n=1 Tax=Heracleum sosnowskyi TaxID=360622 RepID=A0AAD8MQR3_9APIA|nr:F-box protein SKIP19 [Heracleum sosnowskyi]